MNTTIDEKPITLPAVIDASGSLAVALSRSEVDQQIATARQLPRSIAKSVQNIQALAILDDETAKECMFALPRGRGRDAKIIRGPSIRFAEIVASQWGNCRVGTRVVHVDRTEKYIEAEGIFHDLETNMATTARIRRRISDSKGYLYSDDMIVMTGNAAAAFAKRNAILGAVPKPVWRRAYDAVETVIRGDEKTFAQRRDSAILTFDKKLGVNQTQIFSALGVYGIDDIGPDHLVTLTAMRSAIQNGEASIDEMFPKNGNVPHKSTKNQLDALAHDPATGDIISDEIAAAAQASAAAMNTETGAESSPVPQVATEDALPPMASIP